MTLLSSVALAPSVAGCHTSGIDLVSTHPDCKLIELGRDFDVAYAHERACYHEADKLCYPDLSTCFA